jgi:DNA-binding NarL/FixJ family response regulator
VSKPWRKPVPRPNIVLMDIRMRRMDGIQATRAITAANELRDVRVLILTTYDTDAYVFEGLEAGASGFLLKDAGPAELMHGIRVVAAGEAPARRRWPLRSGSPSTCAAPW